MNECLNQEFITIRVCNCHMVATTSPPSRQYDVAIKLHVHRLCKLGNSHLGAGSCYYFTTDCTRHTAKMVVVDTIWQLHTLIVMDSWFEHIQYMHRKQQLFNRYTML